MGQLGQVLMSTYSIENDKRVRIVGFIIAFSVILYYFIDYYLFAPYKPEDNVLFDIIFFILPVTSLGIAWILTLLLKPLILKYCGVCNNTGVYEGCMKTSWDNFKTPIPVKITIEQTLFDMKISLKTETSCSVNNTAHVKCGTESKIIFTYMNEGSVDDLEIKIHRGTGELTVSGCKLTGRYYNDPRDRGTYGSLELNKVK